MSDADTQQTGPSWICKSVVMVPMSLLRSKYHRFYHETVNVRPRRRYYTCTLAGMTGSITVVNMELKTTTETGAPVGIFILSKDRLHVIVIKKTKLTDSIRN